MRVFLTRRLPEDVMDFLEDHFELTAPHPDEDRALGAEELSARLTGHDALLCTLADKVDAALLDQHPRLRIVANYAVGYNNIDVSACTARGVAVTNTPEVLTAATADIAFALLLATARRIVEGDRLVRTRQWQGWEPLQLLGTEVTGATLGLVGMGRIGRAMARRARGFEMRLLYWSRTRLTPEAEAELGVEYLPLEDLLPQSDFVSLHLPLTPETHHLLNAQRLGSLKPGAILINTARGAVVDEKALVDALTSGHLGGAGLDVFEAEPQLEPALYDLPQVVIPPHLGSATVKTRTKMGLMAAENILAIYEERRPPHLVDPAWNAGPEGR